MDILLYVIQSRVNLQPHNFRLGIFHIFVAQKASRLSKPRLAIGSDELKSRACSKVDKRIICSTGKYWKKNTEYPKQYMLHTFSLIFLKLLGKYRTFHDRWRNYWNA
jgi:hypothetical protein